MYYNRKYKTVGHLFQDRFKSENVETAPYLLTATRYIHQNPKKAGIVQKPDEWKWSCCLGYYGDVNIRMLNARVVLQLFSNEMENARMRFKEYNERINRDQCLEDEDRKKKVNDDEARKKIKKVLGEVEIPHVKSLPQSQRIPLLRKVKKIEGVSQRQVARILGVSPNLVFKA